jgi:GTP-binding protein Era
MAKKLKNDFVSGFVSIVGRPNAGKSTLLNQFAGAKLAIVTDKPQTTRTTIQGIWTTDRAQVVFLDTPGIHKSDSPLNKRLMQEVRNALEERDLLLYVADATRQFEKADDQALDLVRKTATPALLVLNKIDRLQDKRELLPLIEEWSRKHEFREYFPVSAMRGDGLEELRAEIVRSLPPGPQYFPSGQITDQPERFLAAELIREKILRETRQEVPHSVAVFIDIWQEKKTLTSISATIFVEREGQKGIIIGAGGSLLKKAGTLARRDIEEMLGRKVFLELFVKVRENWRENPAFLNQLDWRLSMSGAGSGAGGETEEPA